MTPTQHPLELLAPAKNADFGIEAIKHGADAVYIGGPAFGARYGAGNDIPDIARGQLQWEDEARAKQPELLILDTHLLSNILWSQTLFGDCPHWLEAELLKRHYDLHLLLSPDDVEWTADGQRCQPSLAERQAFFAASLDWLTDHQQTVQVITGDWQARQQHACAAVEQLMGSRETCSDSISP